MEEQNWKNNDDIMVQKLIDAIRKRTQMKGGGCLTRTAMADCGFFGGFMLPRTEEDRAQLKRANNLLKKALKDKRVQRHLAQMWKVL